MRNSLKWLGVLLLPVVALGGLQGYYYFQVKQALDDFAHTVQPFLHVNYQSVSAWLTQPVVIHGVSVQPQGAPSSPVSIAQIRLQSNATFLPFDHLQQGKVTEPMTLSLQQISYGLVRDERPIPLPAMLVSPLSNLHCESLPPVWRNRLIELGYASLPINLELNLEPSSNQQLMKMSAVLDVQGLMQGKAQMWLRMPQSGSFKRDSLAQAQIQMLNLSARDLGYNQRLQAYCAGQKGIDPNDYPESFSAALSEWVAAEQLTVSDALQHAVTEVRAPGVLVSFKLEPAQPIRLEKVVANVGGEGIFSSSEVSLLLNTRPLEVDEQNWQVVHDILAGNLRRAALAVVITDAQAPDAEPSPWASSMREIVPGVVPIRPPEVEKTFQSTEFEQLKGYVGSAVRLRTFFGREMEGVLVEVGQDGISIQHQVEQGRATFPVARDKISEIQVYR